MPSPSPAFIIGFQRSGTTLLRLMLNCHPEIAIPLDTTGLWDRYERRLGEYGSLDDPADRRRLVRDLLAEERIRLWEVPLTEDGVLHRWREPGYPGVIDAFYASYAAAKGKRLWGDKDPGNMIRLDQLHRWFPDGRVIHIIRDGRDACLSQAKQDFGFDEVLDCAEAWREQVKWVRQIGVILGSRRYLELRYEDLLADPEGHLREICRFLDLPFDPAMLEYHRQVDAAVPASRRHLWPLLDQPPQPSRAFGWKREMSPGVRVGFEKRAGAVLNDLGYEVLPGPVSGGYLEELRRFGRLALRTLRRRLRG